MPRPRNLRSALKRIAALEADLDEVCANAKRLLEDFREMTGDRDRRASTIQTLVTERDDLSRRLAAAKETISTLGKEVETLAKDRYAEQEGRAAAELERDGLKRSLAARDKDLDDAINALAKWQAEDDETEQGALRVWTREMVRRRDAKSTDGGWIGDNIAEAIAGIAAVYSNRKNG